VLSPHVQRALLLPAALQRRRFPGRSGRSSSGGGNERLRGRISAAANNIDMKGAGS